MNDDFETPIMRDISKIIIPIMVGIIIAFLILFSINPMNQIYHSLQWELEQLDRGFTWDDKKLNGCFEREGGLTYFDDSINGTGQLITVSASCSSSALPWETLSWAIPLTVILLIANVLLYRKRKQLTNEG